MNSPKLTDYSAQWENRQPENVNYLRPLGFKLTFERLPIVTYFCQTANIPTISLGTATQVTPFIDMPHPGDKMVFDDLVVRFVVDEDMKNYTEMHNWIVGLGFPESRDQFTAITNAGRKLDRPLSITTGEFGDATLTILSSNNAPTHQIIFQDCFPVSLGALEFDISSGNTNYLQAAATFKYRQYQIKTL